MIATVVYIDGREMPALTVDMGGIAMLPSLIRVQVATAAALLAETPDEQEAQDEPAAPA